MRLTIATLFIIGLFGYFYQPSEPKLKQLTYAEIMALNEKDSILRGE
jgi:hypothetical protein